MKVINSDSKATILLVENRGEWSQTVKATLESTNFNVLHATSGSDAMELAATHEGAIHVLLSDVDVAGMAGLDIAEALKRSYPNMQTILMSEMGGGGLLMLTQGWALVNDPFAPESLLNLVNVVLNASGESRASRRVAKINSGDSLQRGMLLEVMKPLTLTAGSSPGSAA